MNNKDGDSWMLQIASAIYVLAVRIELAVAW